MTRFLLFTALLLVAGCASGPKVDRGNAAYQLGLAQTEIDAGKYDSAMDRLVAVRDANGLIPEDLQQAEDLLEVCVALDLEELDASAAPAKDYKQVFKKKLPGRLRARAGITAARRFYEEGSRVTSFKMIREVEQKVPSHPERVAAGEVLWTTGLDLIRDDRHYLVLYQYSSRGIEALEYLILTYPFNPHCAEAYNELALIYVRRKKLTLAIERYEDLLVYHPASEFSVLAEARLPYLRMLRIKRDDYDRGELLAARRELEQWLERHVGHAMESDVRQNLNV